MANEYPPIWFETFLAPDNAAPVERELEFICAYLPKASFPRLLDVPCGIGRHAGPLDGLGYDMVGIDRSDEAIAMARSQHPNVDFRIGDMFELGSVPDAFDGLLCLWQSFGYGSSDQNLAMLRDMRGRLRAFGRILIDIYNAEALEGLPPEVVEVRAGRTVSTTRRMEAGRLRVELRYSDSDIVDVHDWEIYTPRSFEAAAEGAGFRILERCAWFDPSVQPSAEHLRMQFLMERGQRPQHAS